MPSLIDNWKQAYKFLSTHLAVGAATFGLLPPDQQSALLDLIGLPMNRVPAVIAALFLVARLTKQSNVS